MIRDAAPQPCRSTAIGRRAGRAALLAGLLASLTFAAVGPARAFAASVTVGPGETYTMTGEVMLDPTDTFTAMGTADAPCTIQGNKFSLRATDFTGTVTISHCTLDNVGDTGKPALDLRIKGTAAVRLEDTQVSNSGQVYVLAEDDTNVSILRNDFQANGTIDPAFDSLTRAEPAVMVEGMSTQPKVFQGNRVLRSFFLVRKTQHWLIGGLTEAAGNVFYGIRGGIWLDTVNDVTVQGNYLRTPAPWDKASQLTTLRVDPPSTDVSIEHNVIRGGNGLMFATFDGELAYNILADPHAAMWIAGAHSKNKMLIHHNLLLRSESAEPLANYWRMIGLEIEHSSQDGPVTSPNIEFFNNTMDGANCYNPPGAAIAVAASELAKSVRNNVFMQLAYSNFQSPTAAVTGLTSEHILDPAEDPGPARLVYADYNAFFNTQAPAIDNYGISVIGKTERVDPGFAAHDLGNGDLKNQQVDPMLSGPLPRVFPFSDDDLSARKITVCQVLAYYRKLYAPLDGKSPLIDSGDPADGPGADIGAIGAGAAHPDDKFGLACPADASALAPPSGNVLKCPEVVAPDSVTGGGSGNGNGNGAPTVAPGWLCVCSAAAPPGSADLVSFVGLLGILALRRRRRWTRDR